LLSKIDFSDKKYQFLRSLFFLIRIGRKCDGLIAVPDYAVSSLQRYSSDPNKALRSTRIFKDDFYGAKKVF
jgi:hypothetical protein